MSRTTASIAPVLMLGPDLADRGGIVSVERVILDHPVAAMPLRFQPSLREKNLRATLPLFLRAVAEILLRGPRYRAVLLHMSYRGSAVRKALLTVCARLRGCPPVILAHGSEFRGFWETLPAWRRAVLRAILRRAGILALAPRWQRFYRHALRLPPGRVQVLANAVPVPPRPVSQDADPVRLLFLGRIGPRKGAFDLLAALARLPAGVPDWHLVLAGDGAVDEARAAVARLGLDQRVRVAGWVGPEERDALVAGSQILVLPSYHEGLPMAILEALAAGLVVVTTPVGGIPDAIVDGEHGLLVRPGDPAGLAGALARAIADPALRRRLGAAGRARVAPWNAEDYPHRLASCIARWADGASTAR